MPDITMSHSCQYAYLAGILDGEGWLGIERYERKDTGKMRYRLTVVISNTDLGIINLLKQHTGHGTLQTVLPPPDKNWKVNYRWIIKGGAARFFLEQVKEYIVIKRAQVFLALDGPDTEDKWTKIKALNKRGVGLGEISTSDVA